MRIISGKFRSRKLHTPRDAATTRPIPDRVKESLFSLLRGHFEGSQVLDCFAGTGAMGLEALSRGAERVVFVEKDRRAADLLQKNIDMLEAGEECEVVKSDALGPAAIARCPRPVDLIFFDPPYPLILDPHGWERVSRQFGRLIENLSDDGFAILRTPWPFRHITVIDHEGHVVPAGDSRNPFDIRGLVRKDLPPPSGKKFKGTRDKIYDDDRREWIGDEVDADEIQRESDEELESYQRVLDRNPGEGFKVERRDVDLHLPGALGPETHEYASQAVHLYMKRRD
jgi:16S rRNA (guanine966-N2)-methyltransferase